MRKELLSRPPWSFPYLLPEEQTMLLSEMEYSDCTPNLSQAQRLKELSMQGLFTEERLSAIMSEEKANQKERVKISAERIRKYFPKDYTTAQIEETIVKLCVKPTTENGCETEIRDRRCAYVRYRKS